FSIGFGVFGIVNMQIARYQRDKTKELSIKGNMRDAKEYLDKEEYEVALQNTCIYVIQFSKAIPPKG
ncbi:MAG: hypothetical protein HC831_10330, partial [Chloroflexia bacterium]|nr:hypothetical protein [Chloroflexia bacterium]